MANPLEIDLTGLVVIVRESAMTAQYQGLKYRRFRVEGGFGARAFITGDGIICRCLADGIAETFSSNAIERLATEQEMQREPDEPILPDLSDAPPAPELVPADFAT